MIKNNEGKNDKILVDGGTDPNDHSRFCLGQITNLERSDNITKCRNHIGHGIELVRDSESSTGFQQFHCIDMRSVLVGAFLLV